MPSAMTHLFFCPDHDIHQSMDPVEEIKRKINIVDFVGSYVNLKKAGKNYRALCPFHSEKTPSFMVSPELQIFKCFGCNEAGDLFTFHQKIEGIDFVESLRQLAERTGVPLPKGPVDPDRAKKNAIFEMNHLACEFYHYVLTEHKAGKRALEYLKEKRKLKIITIKDFKIGYAPDSWDSLLKFLASKKHSAENQLSAGLVVKKTRGEGYLDKFRGRIVFPLTGIDGKILGFIGRTIFDRKPKYLNTPDTLVFHKSSFIFGLDKAKTDVRKAGAVFVEGSMDVVSAFQAGIKNVVAATGTSLTVGQLKLLSRYTKDITFCFDSDPAGVQAIHRAIELADKEGFNIKVAIIPDEYKDLDEFLVAKPEKVSKFLEDAVNAYDFFLASALKRHDKNDSIGKKKIVEELVEVFGKVSDSVIRDHYTKEIARELNIEERTVASLLSEYEEKETKEYISLEEDSLAETAGLKKSPQEYILALLFKASVEKAQSITYKLAQKDFTDSRLGEIFVGLKNYLSGRKRGFKIEYFISRIDENLREAVDDLYLWDLGEVSENEKILEKELDAAFERLKKETAKRELKELGDQIRQAELGGNRKELKELSERFKVLSEKLI